MDKVWKVGDVYPEGLYKFKVIDFDAKGRRVSQRIDINEEESVEIEIPEVQEELNAEEKALDETKEAKTDYNDLTNKQLQQLLEKAKRIKESKLRNKTDLVNACNKFLGK